ncbi:DNA polymerase III subunit beta [candidate division WOR-3 bacterium 4484_100]|uniref:Beta sliding clamp n=1 Tax=candidate division WOR-3 bacterium 4484_100 TaxID=1936077 RepID=A0A1V4QH50_UNCW3|nr:MAG: DNA polymerase III subunit beta [candidate division WOR-3 bacterium 4484_100]
MEFKIDKNILEKTMGNIVKIVPPKSTYTILQNIIMEAKDNTIAIQGTDLDIFVKKVIPAEVKEPGKVLIPGKKILEITREANAEEIKFKLKELNLQISAGNAHFNIPSLDYQEFPEVPKFPEKKWFDLSIGELQEMVNSTIFMVARDISRRPMNGVLIQVKDDELRLVTTDGARLALNKRKKIENSGELIVATKLFDLITTNKPEEKIELYIEERMMGVKFMDTTIIARLIEGPYPKYEEVIPKAFVGNCTIEKEILTGALKRVSLVASPHIKNVKFDFQESNVLLSASSPDFGEAKEKVPCVYEGEKLGIWFNAGYLLEILRHISAQDIIMQLTSQSSAALVRPKSEEELIYLLMPLRIDGWE